MNGAILQTSWECLHSLQILTAWNDKVYSWWKNAKNCFLQTDLQMGTLETFTLCTVISEITDTVEAETNIGLLILDEIKRWELTKQMAVTGTGAETNVNNVQIIYKYT